jgi:hypothetical protein
LNFLDIKLVFDEEVLELRMLDEKDPQESLRRGIWSLIVDFRGQQVGSQIHPGSRILATNVLGDDLNSLLDITVQSSKEGVDGGIGLKSPQIGPPESSG